MAVYPKIEERTLYEPIIRYLRGIGFDSVGETKVVKKHPDILFKVNATSFVVEIKIGKPEIGLSAVAQASDYARKLGTDNTVILIYPERHRGQSVLSSEFVNKIALDSEVNALILTEYLTKSIKDTPRNAFKTLKSAILKKKAIVDFNTVVNLIGKYVIDLNSVIYQIKTDELVAEVVDKLDLFCSIGEISDEKTAKNQVVNLASYLLFNQLLFYHIYKRKTQDNRLDELHEIDKVSDIQDFISAITDIDYQPIYQVNILGHIPEKTVAIRTLNEVIKSIKLLRAEHITHDLAGRFFSDLIPFEVRKILAAFYTHPAAAEMLAGLTVESWDEEVIDPACGSGTLLVSAYKKKLELYKKLYGFKDIGKIHKEFVEEDITGIDIMPFAAHIATLNLITQNIEQRTDKVRIAAQDSLSLAHTTKLAFLTGKGIEISPFTREIQETLFQMSGQKREAKGALAMAGKSKGFYLKPVDVVIMNPPFSDREKMPADMRKKLKKNISLISICGNRVNLWGFFLALADLVLKPEGKIGAVLPINIARGEATDKIRTHRGCSF